MLKAKGRVLTYITQVFQIQVFIGFSNTGFSDTGFSETGFPDTGF